MDKPNSHNHDCLHKLGKFEPFFGVFKSPTRDLFEGQAVGERKNEVLYLEKQAEKAIPSFNDANGGMYQINDVQNNGYPRLP